MLKENMKSVLAILLTLTKKTRNILLKNDLFGNTFVTTQPGLPRPLLSVLSLSTAE